MYDTIIVGGGPAGLNAALILGRCRRKVLVCDAGRQRNTASKASHGFLTRDGTNPLELLRLGREELSKYDSVEFRQVTVSQILEDKNQFSVALEDGARFRSRTLLLATGVVDHLPEVQGTKALYGKSIHHCPYCDGWEHRDQPLAVYGKQKDGVDMAIKMKLWSNDVVLCTDGGLI